jgi:hypothetical protein
MVQLNKQEMLMSLHRQMMAIVPDETAEVTRAVFPKGNKYM